MLSAKGVILTVKDFVERGYLLDDGFEELIVKHPKISDLNFYINVYYPSIGYQQWFEYNHEVIIFCESPTSIVS